MRPGNGVCSSCVNRLGGDSRYMVFNGLKAFGTDYMFDAAGVFYSGLFVNTQADEPFG